MSQLLLPLVLIMPILVALFFWFTEEYQFTKSRLSLFQCVLLTLFLAYWLYCLYFGAETIVNLYKDHSYKMARSLSFTGMWTYVVPALIAPLIIFPKECLLYILQQSL